MDEVFPFPFPAIVGQPELKTALVLNLVNPQVGGVLLIGPYGVGKTTAVRALGDVMPLVVRDGRNEPMRIVELPLNARLEDVIGGINERVALEQRVVLLEEGVLARAHGNLLYIDEINKLDAAIIDAILDAAAQGRTYVRRGPMVRLFPTQFVLVGSMNPEEGVLRPQILDRLGLRVWVAPLPDAADRLEIYRRTRDFRIDPGVFRRRYEAELAALREDIAAARELVPYVTVEPAAEELAITIIQSLGILSHRAEITLLEGARARAAADYRRAATPEDVRRVAPLALRMRRSQGIGHFAAELAAEDAEILRHVGSETRRPGDQETRRPGDRGAEKQNNESAP